MTVDHPLNLEYLAVGPLGGSLVLKVPEGELAENEQVLYETGIAPEELQSPTTPANSCTFPA